MRAQIKLIEHNFNNNMKNIFLNEVIISFLFLTNLLGVIIAAVLTTFVTFLMKVDYNNILP